MLLGTDEPYSQGYIFFEAFFRGEIIFIWVKLNFCEKYVYYCCRFRYFKVFLPFLGNFTYFWPKNYLLCSKSDNVYSSHSKSTPQFYIFIVIGHLGKNLEVKIGNGMETKKIFCIMSMNSTLNYRLIVQKCC